MHVPGAEDPSLFLCRGDPVWKAVSTGEIMSLAGF